MSCPFLQSPCEDAPPPGANGVPVGRMEFRRDCCRFAYVEKGPSTVFGMGFSCGVRRVALRDCWVSVWC